MPGFAVSSRKTAHLKEGVLKQCNVCCVYKRINDFYRDSSRPDGYAYKCKGCSKKVPSKTIGTLAYFKRSSWNNINSRTINGSCADSTNPKNKAYFEKGVKLTMTKNSFYRFCDENENTIMKIYKSGEIPTVDRIDSNKNYHINNIQIMSLKDNIIKSNKGKKK